MYRLTVNIIRAYLTYIYNVHIAILEKRTMTNYRTIWY